MFWFAFEFCAKVYLENTINLKLRSDNEKFTSFAFSRCIPMCNNSFDCYTFEYDEEFELFEFDLQTSLIPLSLQNFFKIFKISKIWYLQIFFKNFPTKNSKHYVYRSFYFTHQLRSKWSTKRKKEGRQISTFINPVQSRLDQTLTNS